MPEVTPDNLIGAVLTTLSESPQEKSYLEEGRLAKLATVILERHRGFGFRFSSGNFLAFLVGAQALFFLWMSLDTPRSEPPPFQVAFLSQILFLAMASIGNSFDQRRKDTRTRLIVLVTHWLAQKPTAAETSESEEEKADLKALQIELHLRY